MQKHRNQKADDQKAIFEKPGQTVLIKGFRHHLRNPEQREIHPFLVEGLAAEQVYDTQHDKITKQDKCAPYHQRDDPGRPGNFADNLQPSHLTCTGKAVV